jgi:alpha-1,2-glucosyltransferase
MLYIWPFTAFFSLPLIYQTALDLLFRLLPASLRLLASFPRPGGQLEWSTVAWLLGSLAVSLVIVHFNTIIHPFTLADNRHYIFYVFRYTIRRHPLVKYALAPIYVICGWLVLHCLAGAPVAEAIPTEKRLKAKPDKVIPRQTGKSLQAFRPRMSFAFIWLVATVLSLVTAPLVEPRYFIIPWVIWRLHVPNLTSTNTEAKELNKPSTKGARDASTASWASYAKYWAYKGHDHRLWIETLWYLLISTVTGCIFLFKGFEWPQEPRKVQRFMW